MNLNGKAIIFDCDGVLVDSEIIYNAIERKYLSKIGLFYTDAEYQSRFIGLTSSAYIQELSADFSTISNEQFPEDFAINVANECSIEFETDLKSLTGVEYFIDQLICPIAVASSSDLEMLNKKLTITGLQKYFGSHIYSGEQVKNGKPAPDIFLLAANGLGVRVDQCIVIEDSINGVTAGINAGMEVWGFTGGGHIDTSTSNRLTSAGATKVFSDFSSISDHITN